LEFDGIRSCRIFDVVLLPVFREPAADRREALGWRVAAGGGPRRVGEVGVTEGVLDGSHGEVQGLVELVARGEAVGRNGDGLLPETGGDQERDRHDAEHGQDAERDQQRRAAARR